MNANRRQILFALYSGYQTKSDKHGSHRWVNREQMKKFINVPSLNNSDTSALMRAGLISQDETGSLYINKWGEIILRNIHANSSIVIPVRK